MIPSLSNTETNVKLPFSFIFYSLLAFSASQVILIFSGDFLTNGVFRIPPLWMAAHFLLLGWALMVAMGAMYQLVPVVFLTPIWNETFGFFQFWVTAIGITGFALSLAYFLNISIIFGIITFIGIVMFLIQMSITINKQAEKSILTLFVGSALFCLLLTIFIGILLAASVSGQLPLTNHVAMVKTHVLVGVAGWFTLLIFGFSYKMVPMLSLSHGFSMKLSKLVYMTYMFGLLMTTLSFWFEANGLFQIGIVLLFIGFSLFLWHVQKIIKKRLKKKLDQPFIFSLIAIVNGWVLHLVAVILSITAFTSTAAWGILIYLYIVSWIVFSIIGYLYKIVPFLWWTYRYSKEMGKPNVPTLKQLMNEKLGVYLFISFYICMVGLLLSFGFKLPSLYTSIQTILAVVSIVFSGAIINVVRK